MHLSKVAVITLLATLASAQNPRKKEIDVSNMVVRNIANQIENVLFDVQPYGISCNATATDLAADQRIPCGTKKEWAFTITEEQQKFDKYNLTVYQGDSPPNTCVRRFLLSIAPSCDGGQGKSCAADDDRMLRIYDSLDISLSCDQGSKNPNNQLCQIPSGVGSFHMTLTLDGGPRS